MNRRDALLCGASLGVGALLPTSLFSQTGDRLQYPKLLDATESRRFRLTAQSGSTRFKGGAATSTMGFNQDYLGPTIRVLTDTETQAEVRNELGEAITTHWHGLLIPGEVDGGPHQPIGPGQIWQPILALDQPPATTWYHSHFHGATARQVMLGLAGVLHVTDGADDARGLPSEYGVDDLTLVLQDRQFNWRGRLKYDVGMHQVMNGFRGDTILVNGQIDTSAVVPQGVVRCRLVNGSNARIYGLRLSDDRPLQLIATDGGFLDQPLALNRLILAPGERCEVLIDFSDGAACTLLSDDISNSAMGGMMGGRRAGGRISVLPFVVDTALPSRIDSLPDALDGEIPNLPLSNATVRQVSLNMSMGMGMMMSRSARQFSINNVPFDAKELNFATRLDAIERWVVRADMMMHPFHIHGVRFQVLSESGRQPKAQNRGWKDTVLIDQQVELAMKFEKPAPPTAPYMYHCHILEHEDGGMMGQFSVG